MKEGSTLIEHLDVADNSALLNIIHIDNNTLDSDIHVLHSDKFFAGNIRLISKLLDSCFHTTPPFIAHGLVHHLRVASNVLRISGEVDSERQLSLRDQLLLSALLHDVFRLHDIEGCTIKVERLLENIGRFYGNAFAGSTVDLILAHDEIGNVDSIEKAILFVSDKLDYSFERGFIVQLYDKFLTKEKSDPVLTTAQKQDKILSELTAKKNRDLASVTLISKKFPMIPVQYIEKIRSIHEETELIAIGLINAYGVNMDSYEQLVKKILMKSIVAELKIKKIFGLRVPERKLLYCQLKFVKAKAPFLKRIFVEIFSCIGGLKFLMKK